MANRLALAVVALASLMGTVAHAQENRAESKEPRLPIPLSNPGTWVTPSDYPIAALREKREGSVKFSVSVNKDGTVRDCAIFTSSGSPDLDEATCRTVTARATFKPATDAMGNPVNGKYTSTVRWQLPDWPQTRIAPEYAVSPPNGPHPETTPYRWIEPRDYPPAAFATGEEGAAMLALDVDATGAVTGCTVTDGTGFPRLDEASCDVAKRQKFRPAQGDNGEAAAGTYKNNLIWRAKQPEFDTMAIAIAFTLEADGSVTDCEVVRQSGNVPKELTPDQVCRRFGGRGVPYRDSNGNPVFKRVTLSFSSDVEDAPADAAHD